MANRVKPVLDCASYAARVNLEKSQELKWRDDVSYFWVSIVKMKRRAVRRQKLRSQRASNEQTTPS